MWTPAWIEGGAFVAVRGEVDDPRFPDGISIFGSDDTGGELWLVYFDERPMSRHYHATLTGSTLTWWRDSADLSQRFELVIASDGQTMTSRGQMSQAGGPWEDDLSQAYRRAGSTTG